MIRTERVKKKKRERNACRTVQNVLNSLSESENLNKNQSASASNDLIA